MNPKQLAERKAKSMQYGKLRIEKEGVYYRVYAGKNDKLSKGLSEDMAYLNAYDTLIIRERESEVRDYIEMLVYLGSSPETALREARRILCGTLY